MHILSAALSTLSASPTVGLLLAGELAAAAWMVERFARQTIKIRKQDQALAYERTFSRSLSRLDHEVYLLLRRSDTFPLYVAGDLPGLTGLTLEDMQRDIACFFQLMSAADAKTLRRMLEEWDRSAPLRLTFYSKWEGRWLELCALPAENSHYTMLNLRDVSTLRQRQEEMAQQLEEPQAASRSKTEFLSRMSHEIRTPINGINGLMTLTRTRLGGSNPEAEEYLTRAEDLSQHLLSVINDILDLSRIETGKTELEQKSFDLYALGDQLRSMFQKTVEAKGLRFHLEFKNFTVRYVVGDQLRITQVLLNFLSNAVNFTSHGEISVTFRQMMRTDDTVSFLVAVKDTGKGMDPKFITSIFRPFQQENASIAKTYGGSGLGMAITDQLVRLMGGEIVVDSMPGRGSTFTVYLHLPMGDSPALAAEQKEETDGFSFEGRRILMAEDNETNAEIAVSILEEVHGAHVEVAHNGREAVDMFSAHPAGYYDFILMDVQMPVMDGRTAARTIRALPRPDAKTELIFALSADAFLEDERQSVEAGMNGHFSKPVNYDELRRCVGTFFKSREDG